MKTYKINTDRIKDHTLTLNAGDRVFLSGTVYTARDAAHKRFFSMLDNGDRLPFDISSAVIYYAGPTPAPEGRPIGSCGPTTSGRMDPYTPKLLDMGLVATVGKGGRSPEVCEAIIRNKSVYFCAVGGAGALAAGCVTSCDVVAFEDLGCESVKRLSVENFPVVVAIDCHGGTLFGK